MIQVQNLHKVFRIATVETAALHAISLEIRAGELVAITGPSGCGKSTLLNVLGLLAAPTSGDYYFLGENVARYRERQRAKLRKARIGFVFQSFNLIDSLTVAENVELPLTYLGVGSAERKRATDVALERMEIAHRRDHLPSQLSGGEQQRVAIARAVVAKPDLVLADEPTGNLDSQRGAEAMELLRQLHREGTTLVLVTHSQDVAAAAERALRMQDGQLLAAA